MDANILCEVVKFKKSSPIWIFHHTDHSSHSIASHWHQDIELNFLDGGEGWIDFYIDGRHEILKPGGVCLINSGEVHSAIPSLKGGDNATTGITMIISYEFLKRLIPNIDQMYWRLETWEDQKKIAEFMKEISRVSQADRPEAQVNVRLVGLMCSILSILCENCMYSVEEFYPEEQRNSERIRKILDYIHEHYQNPLTQEALAQEFYFSRGYFSSFFKKYTGKTFKTYLTEIRLLHAEQMLKETKRSISQIAQDAGFSDERRFIETFKKYYEKTPGAYRKNIS